MIEKVLKIRNVGRFVDYSYYGDVAFRPLTLIFSENGQGKTTLSAILRSLRTGEAKWIQERSSLGQSGEPSVALLVRGANVDFTSGGWDNALSEMEIFDPTFVDENVYSGCDVKHEHRKNLHRFAIGEQGVGLAKRLDETDDAIREINPQMSSLKDNIGKHILGGMSLKAFMELRQVDDVEQRISAKEKEIETLKKAEVIVGKPLLAAFTLPGLPFSGIESLLSKQLEDVSADAERMVKQHISRCMDEAGESWLSQGMQYVKDEKCPFCGEPIEGLELVASYRDYFSRAYADLKREITRTSEIVAESLSEDRLLALQESTEGNKSLSEFWREYVAADFPAISFEDVKVTWSAVRRLLAEHLGRKAALPLESVVLSKELREAMMSYNEAREAIVEYNRRIEGVNRKIMEKKEEIKSADLNAAKGELQQMQNTKKRFSEAVVPLCAAYQSLQEKKAHLEQDKTKARKELQRYTRTVLNEYQSRINDYLEKFGAGFRIVEATESHLGGKPSLSYRISINGVAVDLEASQSPEPTPCFKNTLSSGDKSALACAFFLARLDKDPNLGDKVVVFDDPISSLDGYRRTCTQQHVLRVAGVANQVILLSHDPYFLWLTWQNAERSSVKALSITRKRSGQCHI